MKLSLFIFILFFPIFISAIDTNSHIAIIGDDTFVTEALLLKCRQEGFTNVSYTPLMKAQQHILERIFMPEEIDYIFLVGNTPRRMAEFLYDDEQINISYLREVQVLQLSFAHKIKKLLYVLPECIYPDTLSQPITAQGFLKSTKISDLYQKTKLAAIQLCGTYNEAFNTQFIPCISANLYGPNDLVDDKKNASVTGLIAQIFDAQAKNRDFLLVRSAAKNRCEYLYIDDFTDACLFLLQNSVQQELINIGYGNDTTFEELAQHVIDQSNCKKPVIYDITANNVPVRKVLHSGLLQSMGWSPKVTLQQGIKETVSWYKKQYGQKEIDLEKTLQFDSLSN